MDKKYLKSFVPYAVIVVCSVLLSTIVIAALMMRPVADDYAYFSDPAIHNPLAFALHYYMDWTGRFMQALWMSFLYKAFDAEAVIYGTIIQLVLLIGSAIFASQMVLRKANLPTQWIIATGLSVAVLFVFMTRSIFDTNLWVTSSTVYIGSAIGLLTGVGVAALLLHSKKITWWHLLILAVVVFAAQLFSEPTSVICIYIGALALGFHYILRRNKRGIIIAWTWFVSSILGFIFMYLSPGTRARKDELDTSSSLLDSVSGAFGDFGNIAYIFTSFRTLLLIALALALVPLVARLSKRTKLLALCVALVSTFTLPFILFFATHYSLGGYTPARAYTVPAALFSLSIVTCLALAISFIPAIAKPKANSILKYAFVVVISIALVSSLKAVTPIIQVTALRTALYDSREAQIITQVSTQAETLVIQPLPVLLDSTDAVDLYYNDDTPAWLEDSFRKYYGIEKDTAINNGSQPAGYCVEQNNPYWFGAKSCEELNEQ